MSKHEGLIFYFTLYGVFIALSGIALNNAHYALMGAFEIMVGMFLLLDILVKEDEVCNREWELLEMEK